MHKEVEFGTQNNALSHCILQQMEHTCTLWLDGSVLFILLLRACVAE